MFEEEGASDMDVMLEGIDFMFRLINSETMKKYGAVYNGTKHPACGAHEFLSRDYWRCVLRQQVGSAYHGVGTCSLGSVLDSKFRVNGISNLWVVDASVFPAPPNSNLNGPVMMIAEKAASDILQFWKLQRKK
ncbi:unnamed protein product [Orchesella dallaii]|uniref:Glucose-methanol-choline oxidoreductase C-terminal domain-containing protein n=1 Tax=Orchesella dallaii TaxID=48710 RepID=A0ABP1RLQ5_9HEXA